MVLLLLQLLHELLLHHILCSFAVDPVSIRAGGFVVGPGSKRAGGLVVGPGSKRAGGLVVGPGSV